MSDFIPVQTGDGVSIHRIPVGSTITAMQNTLNGVHIGYQNGTKLTHVNANFGPRGIHVEVLEVDYKKITIGLG
jgi:hypothetical protein